MHQLKVHDLIHLLLGDGHFNFGLDTLYIAKKSIRSNQNVGTPSAYNLATLYQIVTGKLPDKSHRAMADVKATGTIFCFFWEEIKECYFLFAGDGGEPFQPL
jgi:DNA polymerase III alpha subunit (gram-positive type)